MQLLLFRPRPQEDELFSSWMVRLAWANAQKLHPFCKKVLRGRPSIWTRDIDLSCTDNDLAMATGATAIPIERLFETTLRAAEGFLFEDTHLKGPTHWVMPIRKYGRTRLGHGQQYCGLCLKADERPYFRRAWRMAFSVVCAKHGVILHDACPRCAAAVSFHEGDFGERYISHRECPLYRCKRCGSDLRRGDQQEATEEMIAFQAQLDECQRAGHHQRLPGALSYSLLMFNGLHRILRVLISPGRGGRLGSHMQAEQGLLPLRASENHRHRFEELRVGDRYLLLDIARRLLHNWPYDFIDACRTARVSSAYIHDHRTQLPYWLYREVNWYLYDRYYAPNDAERQSVREFLVRHEIPVSNNEINRWLGVAHLSGSSKDHFLRKPHAWNSRSHGARRG